MGTGRSTAGSMLAVLLAACDGPPPEETAPEPWVAPENGWPSARPPDGLVGEGLDVGQVVLDVRLPDQRGDEVSLWQFSGRVVLLTISAMWCDPCRDLATDAEEVVAGYGEDVVLVTILEEDYGGLRPDVADAASWAASFGDGSPVLADVEQTLADALAGEFPVILGVGRDLVVAGKLGGGTADDLRDLIEPEL